MTRPHTKRTLAQTIIRHIDSTLTLIEATLWVLLLSKIAKEAASFIQTIK